MRKVIRVSYGSAVELGLVEGRLSAPPLTAYLFLSGGACRGRCAFCPQSVGRASQRISRVDWPEFPMDSVLGAIGSSSRIERVCIQCSDEEAVRKDLPDLVGRIAGAGGKPISVSMAPADSRFIKRIKEAGTESLTIPIDCASPSMFRAVKGRARKDYIKALDAAVAVFGRGRVGTHVIVGLGESERDVVLTLAEAWGMGIRPSLFAFTPVKGAPMEGVPQPSMVTYRRLQLTRYVIVEMDEGSEGFTFDASGRLVGFPIGDGALASLVRGGKPFQTSGCPGCNRPYFNERAGGPIYNFPFPPSERDTRAIEAEVLGSTSTD